MRQRAPERLAPDEAGKRHVRRVPRAAADLLDPVESSDSLSHDPVCHGGSFHGTAQTLHSGPTAVKAPRSTLTRCPSPTTFSLSIDGRKSLETSHDAPSVPPRCP